MKSTLSSTFCHSPIKVKPITCFFFCGYWILFVIYCHFCQISGTRNWLVTRWLYSCSGLARQKGSSEPGKELVLARFLQHRSFLTSFLFVQGGYLKHGIRNAEIRKDFSSQFRTIFFFLAKIEDNIFGLNFSVHGRTLFSGHRVSPISPALQLTVKIDLYDRK